MEHHRLQMIYTYIILYRYLSYKTIWGIDIKLLRLVTSSVLRLTSLVPWLGEAKGHGVATSCRCQPDQPNAAWDLTSPCGTVKAFGASKWPNKLSGRRTAEVDNPVADRNTRHLCQAR